ncbi:hypothetical protein [Bradyrhizobium sp. 2S1]|uniref:hypothetical protein n=1 Tax=Bradyrhizobium sp. 2S1 TaxID=1404429 RepID=UPI00140CEC17|nr:hypothetical protein [Bradyrhizobium sp. 2S1]MCK7670533.1 hypothetical protein [Bradyrhizobium sp. 2S1]
MILEPDSAFGGFKVSARGTRSRLSPRHSAAEERVMIAETQIHTIAWQMLQTYGPQAIAQAAQNAVDCESKGETEQARDWQLTAGNGDG